MKTEFLKKFQKKTSENVNYSNWFAKNVNTRQTRQDHPYKDELALTSRLYKASICTMRRILNGQTPDLKDPTDICGALDKTKTLSE